jgi:L-ribulose-5-phosphate 3-epimerase
MARIKIGISLRSLPMPLRPSLQSAQRLGVAGVDLAAKGDLLPQNLTQSGRREVRHLLRSLDLELTAVFCPLRRGLDVAENQEARIDFVRQVMSLSFDLGPRLVIVQAGRMPEKEDEPNFPLMRDALSALARHGDRTGTRLALDAGLESAEALNAFLNRLDTGSLAVNFNPANMLIAGHNPYESARIFRQRTVHIDAQDARRVSPNRTATVPLGHGDIDWMLLLSTLEEIEYRGPINVLTDDAAELAGGVSFLRRLVM